MFRQRPRPRPAPTTLTGICLPLLILLLPLVASAIAIGDAAHTNPATNPATEADAETAMEPEPETVVEHTTDSPRRPLRLPNTTYPLRYHLHIVTNIHRSPPVFDYSGNVTIDVLVKESTNEIVLHAKNLTDYAITMWEAASGDLLDDIVYSYDPLASFLVVHPRENYQAFEAGQTFRLEILFGGVMSTKTVGVYWLTHSDADNRTVYLAATQFEPTGARYAFPCYDEPAFKSNFSLRITHGSNYTAISNMQVLGEPQPEPGAGDDMTTTSFRESPPMSTYLVAFVVSDFEHIVEEHRGVVQRVFTSPDAVNRGHEALHNAVRTVAALEDYLGIPYSLPKLDHIALQKNYGAAMENWGLITYKEGSLLHSADEEQDVHKRLRDLLTQNHEIAHQWFGNLVSPQWWTFAWLNEGFATYFGYIVTDLLHPEYKAMDFFLTDVAERAYSYITARPMTHYVEKEAEIISVFDYITYQRAACVIKMFHHAFNGETFVRGINRFLTKFQYATANEDQLFEALQEAVLEDESLRRERWSGSVAEIMASWTHSEWIPIVVVRYDYERHTITIEQRSKDVYSRELWWIPINFATGARPDFHRTRADYFLPPVSEVTLPAAEVGLVDALRPDDWLIVNKQQTGFYHVLYDDANLLAIAKQLQRNHSVIHPLNRASIFQDICPLIENNEIHSVEVVFELFKYLEHEMDLIPWNSVADAVAFFEKNLHGSTAHVLFRQFVRRLVAPIFHKLAQLPPANRTNTEIQVRQKVLEMACVADLGECLEYTRHLAHDYIFRHVQFQADMDYYAMHDSILCLGVKYLSDEEFDAILELLSKSERNTLWYDDLIYALRCTQSRSHLRQYLQLLVGENSTHIIMNDNESMMYLFYLYKANLAARPVVWRFFENNYKILCQSPFFVENFNRIAEYVPKRHHQQFLALRQLVAEELQTSGAEEAHGMLIEATSGRIGKKVKIIESFLEKFGQDIYDWLRRDQADEPAAQHAASLGARNAAFSLGNPLHMAGRLVRKLIKI